MKPTETPDTVHGRLLESVHFSGYSFERACGELEWLLERDRWKQVGPGYDDIHAFMQTVDLSEFTLAIEQRKKLAVRLQELKASQRATARMLGVGRRTIQRDLGLDSAGGSNEPLTVESPQENTTAVQASGSSEPSAWFQADADPSREAKRVTRRRARAEDRARRKLLAGSALADLEDCDIAQRDIRTDYQGVTGIDAIITDPPYERGALPLYKALARLAARTLAPEGVCAVMTGQLICPEVAAIMRRHLPYRWLLAYLMPGGQAAQQFSAKVNNFWKPILLFGAPREWIGDVVRSATNDNDKRFHHWGQSESGIRDLVDRLTKPGDLVCDPFLGGGTTALVCRATNRRFIGGDLDDGAVRQARMRCSEITPTLQSGPSEPAGVI